MELSDLLAQPRSKRLSVSISDWIGQNARLVEELMTWCYDESSDYKEMACWVMADILDRKPYLLKPHLETILNACKKEGYSDTVYRNSFRVLARIYVPLELEERLIDVAFTYFENKKNAIAIRMFCTIILGEHLDQYPEVAEEFCLMLEDELPHASTGFANRGRKVIKKLRKE